MIGTPQKMDWHPSIREVLEKIRNERGGPFKHLRAYEIFIDSNVDKSPAELFAELAGMGFVCLVGLSNFPYLPHAVERGVIPFPGAVLSKLCKVSQRSNRFPPDRFLVWKHYVEKLEQFLDDLEQRLAAQGKSLGDWSFEIGNEPDAWLYFWGLPDEFVEVVHKAKSVLQPRSLTVGAAGFTSSLPLQEPGDHGWGYQAIAKELAKEIDFLSFHLYKYEDLDERIDALRPIVNGASRRILSEWNVSEQNKFDANDRIDSPAFMSSLLDLGVIAAELDIARVYVHTLIDDADAALGIFTKMGEAKLAYGLIKRFRAVVEAGYLATRSGPWILIHGPGGGIVGLSEKIRLPSPHHFDAEGLQILETSRGTSIPRNWAPGDWVVLDGPAPARAELLGRLSP